MVEPSWLKYRPLDIALGFRTEEVEARCLGSDDGVENENADIDDGEHAMALVFLEIKDVFWGKEPTIFALCSVTS